MKILRNILGVILVAIAITMLAVVGLASAGNAADSTTTGYSDGVSYQGELNWGAPSNLHIAENGDACIDPPVWVWLTLHVEIDGVESPELTQVFPYEHNEPGYVCVPFPLPECPKDDDDPQDITWAAYGTWNIGTGESNEIGGTIDCTPEIPVPPVVEPPVETPPIVPAAFVPIEGETPAPIGTLPVTGGLTLEHLITGLGLVTVGLAMRHFGRGEVRPAVRKDEVPT